MSGAAVGQGVTVLFSQLLLDAMDGLLIPLIDGYVAVSCAWAAVDSPGLKKLGELMKGAAALILLPYVLATEDLSALTWNAPSLLLLLVLGVVHTGWAYSLYFGSMGALPAQTVALCSYLDPVTAVLLSALVLREPLGLPGAVGAALVLGAALVSELPERKRQ